MINTRSIKAFCNEDPKLIENYDKAIADKTQTWHCHHRGELTPCGIFSKKDLIKYDLYFNRPANELILLLPTEHRKLHKRKHFTDIHRKRLSAKKSETNKTQNCNRHWYTNGSYNRFCYTSPGLNWKPGKINFNKEHK